jgi:integrase
VKGRKEVQHPITQKMRRILMEAMANPTEFVFTYVSKRTRDGRVRGERVPITQSGVKTMWRRAKHNRAGSSLPADLPFHDLRSDFASHHYKTNKDVIALQKAMHHGKIETTRRYTVHV